MSEPQVFHAWQNCEREPELVFLNRDGQEVACSSVTRTRTLVGPSEWRKKMTYLGEVTTFVRRLKPANPTIRFSEKVKSSDA